MNAQFGRRAWVKLWVTDWLDGTTRYEMSGAQRAFWIDLLAMAGRSRIPGMICAGRIGERIVGYPLSVFNGLDAAGELNVAATLDLFESSGKIQVEVTQEAPLKLLKIKILNWEKYQSEYSRQKRYRDQKLQPKLQPETRLSDMTEGEVEGEVEQKHSANPSGPHDSVSASSDLSSEELAVVRRVWAYYIDKLGKNPKLLSFTEQRKRKGLARFRECLEKVARDTNKAESLMRIAVDALAASAFHCGENDRKKKYDSWEKHLFPSQEKLESWLDQE
jgi:hypothetical protein